MLTAPATRLAQLLGTDAQSPTLLFALASQMVFAAQIAFAPLVPHVHWAVFFAVLAVFAQFDGTLAHVLLLAVHIWPAVHAAVPHTQAATFAAVLSMLGQVSWHSPTLEAAVAVHLFDDVAHTLSAPDVPHAHAAVL